MLMSWARSWVSRAPCSPHPELHALGESVRFSLAKTLEQKGERTVPPSFTLCAVDLLENNMNSSSVEQVREHFPKGVAFVLAFCDARLVRSIEAVRKRSFPDETLGTRALNA